MELYLFDLHTSYRSGESDRDPYTQGVLSELHHLVITGLYECAGNIRRDATDHVVINAGFTPASPADVALRLPDLFARCRSFTNYYLGLDPSESKTMQATWFCAGAFHELMLIHPFRGGNGRVGRAFLDLLMARLGLIVPPMTLLYYFGQRRSMYFHCLQRADGGDLRPLAEFLDRGILETRIDGMVSRLKTLSASPTIGRGFRMVLSNHSRVFDASKRAHLSDQEFERACAKALRALEKHLDRTIETTESNAPTA